MRYIFYYDNQPSTLLEVKKKLFEDKFETLIKDAERKGMAQCGPVSCYAEKI